MSKRLIIIFFILILIGAAGGAYWYFSQKGLVPGFDQFPGGSGLITGGTQGGGTTDEDEPTNIITTDGFLPRLYQLHNVPVSGVGFTETKDKKGIVLSSAVRYLERGMGHIFETNLSTYKEARIVNETRPRIAEALWGNNGNSVVVRFVDEKNGGVIKSRIVNIEAPLVSFARGSSTSEDFLLTEEHYLPDAIPFMATAEDSSDKLFYLEKGVAGTTGTTATFNNTSIADIFSSAFTEWLPQLPNQNLVTLTTRPSAKVPGHMFFLDTKTKAVSKVLNEINGLTTLTNRDGKFVLFSETVGNTSELSFYDVAKREVHQIYLMSLPEKCVWSTKKPSLAYCAVPIVLPSATYPDQWYQGLVSFSDALWEIDATTFETRKILTPSTLGAPALDMINLSLTSDDSFLAFIDKNTGMPWVYSIVEPKPIVPAVIETPTQSPATSSPAVSTTTSSREATTTKTAVAPSVITSDMQKLK